MKVFNNPLHFEQSNSITPFINPQQERQERFTFQPSVGQQQQQQIDQKYLAIDRFNQLNGIHTSSNQRHSENTVQSRESYQPYFQSNQLQQQQKTLQNSKLFQNYKNGDPLSQQQMQVLQNNNYIIKIPPRSDMQKFEDEIQKANNFLNDISSYHQSSQYTKNNQSLNQSNQSGQRQFQNPLQPDNQIFQRNPNNYNNDQNNKPYTNFQENDHITQQQQQQQPHNRKSSFYHHIRNSSRSNNNVLHQQLGIIQQNVIYILNKFKNQIYSINDNSVSKKQIKENIKNEATQIHDSYDRLLKDFDLALSEVSKNTNSLSLSRQDNEILAMKKLIDEFLNKFYKSQKQINNQEINNYQQQQQPKRETNAPNYTNNVEVQLYQCPICDCKVQENIFQTHIGICLQNKNQNKIDNYQPYMQSNLGNTPLTIETSMNLHDSFYKENDHQQFFLKFNKKIEQIIQQITQILQSHHLPMTQKILQSTIQDLSEVLMNKDIQVTKKIIKKIEVSLSNLQNDSSSSFNIYLYLQGVQQILQEKDQIQEKTIIMNDISNINNKNNIIWSPENQKQLIQQNYGVTSRPIQNPLQVQTPPQKLNNSNDYKYNNNNQPEYNQYKNQQFPPPQHYQQPTISKQTLISADISPIDRKTNSYIQQSPPTPQQRNSKGLYRPIFDLETKKKEQPNILDDIPNIHDPNHRQQEPRMSVKSHQSLQFNNFNNSNDSPIHLNKYKNTDNNFYNPQIRQKQQNDINNSDYQIYQNKDHAQNYNKPHPNNNFKQYNNNVNNHHSSNLNEQSPLSEKMYFYDLARKFKETLNITHPGRQLIVQDLYQQALIQNIPQHAWQKYIKDSMDSYQMKRI